MFLSVGVKVTILKRIQFGDFTLNPDLAESNYRPLNQKSYKSLKLFRDESIKQKKALKLKLFSFIYRKIKAIATIQLTTEITIPKILRIFSIL